MTISSKIESYIFYHLYLSIILLLLLLCGTPSDFLFETDLLNNSRFLKMHDINLIYKETKSLNSYIY